MYTFEISLPAASKEEAQAKLAAASVLLSKLSARELTKLADVVKNDPLKTSLAKKALGL
jgi:hypothetical protein